MDTSSAAKRSSKLAMVRYHAKSLTHFQLSYFLIPKRLMGGMGCYEYGGSLGWMSQCRQGCTLFPLSQIESTREYVAYPSHPSSAEASRGCHGSEGDVGHFTQACFPASRVSKRRANRPRIPGFLNFNNRQCSPNEIAMQGLHRCVQSRNEMCMRHGSWMSRLHAVSHDLLCALHGISRTCPGITSSGDHLVAFL